MLIEMFGEFLRVGEGQNVVVYVVELVGVLALGALFPHVCNN